MMSIPPIMLAMQDADNGSAAHDNLGKDLAAHGNGPVAEGQQEDMLMPVPQPNCSGTVVDLRCAVYLI